MRFNRTRKCKKKRRRRNNTMKNLGGNPKQAQPIFIHARGIENTIPLICPICKNNLFYTQTSMLRGGRWASFFDAEWLFDKSATVCICSQCSKMQWFKDKKVVIPDLR